MKNNKVLAALALVVGALAITLGWRHLSSPAMELHASSAVGEVLAEETARLLGPGAKVAIVGRSEAREGQSAAAEQIASLTKALKRRGSPAFVATEWLPAPAPGAMDLGGITAAQLLQLAEKDSTASALVIFAGLPPFSPELAQSITGRSKRIIAVCGYGANLRKWLESRTVACAAVPRLSEPPTPGGRPKTPREWFAREFELLTPESIPQLPY